MKLRIYQWTLCAMAVLALGASAQVLSPVSGGGKTSEKEARRVFIVVLARDGFEPPKLGVGQGPFTILVRDLTGSFNTRMELRQAGNKSAPVLATKEQNSRRLLMNEMQLDLAPGEYVLRVADSKDRQLEITVSEK